MKTVAFLVLLIFAVFGFSEFIHLVKMRLLFPKKKYGSRLVIDLKKDIAEKQVLYLCEQYNWYGESFANTVKTNAEDLDLETLEKCKNIAKRYDIEI